MHRLLPCALLLVSACGVKVETRSGPTESIASSDPAPGEPTTTTPVPVDDEPSLSRTPEPVGMLLTSMGSLRSGPITVEVSQDDGRPYCSFTRRIVPDDPDSPENERVHAEIGGGFHITDDASAPWLVYVHTTHELYAFDGKGGLKRQEFELLADNRSESTIRQLTSGETWSPGGHLLETLPTQLLEKIDAALESR